jgi:hypothetical protein
MKTTIKMVKGELKRYCKGSRLTSQEVNLETMQAITWQNITAEAMENMPFTCSVLAEIVQKHRKP